MRIGVFTSGGDAPGMNACIRAVVRSSHAAGVEVWGIRRGYAGLLEEDFYVSPVHLNGQMGVRSVSNIIHRGGTILRTSRSDEFQTQAGQEKAASILNKHAIDGLIAIGGDGTFHGAVALRNVWNGRILGCPGTIDNDLFGTDYTIGFDTAINTVMTAIDKLRDTADATERLFLIEVMGRHSGYIAVDSALSSGAEQVLVPEIDSEIETVVKRLEEGRQRGKTSSMVIIAEGNQMRSGLEGLRKYIEESTPYEARVLVLGHLQRGGSPSARDRILASRLGDFAVRSILEGSDSMMAGEMNGSLTLTPLEDTWNNQKKISESSLTLLDILAR